MTDSNEWFKINKNIVTVGISLYAKEEIGDIVHVVLPVVGKDVKKDQEVLVLESTKSAFDIYAPCSGKIVEVNRLLEKDLSFLNTDPEGKGWLFKIESIDLKELEEL